MEETPLKPMDLMAGNFIDCFGDTVIVEGIVKRKETDDWFIQHSGSSNPDNPMGEGVEFSAYPIPLTDDWKRALRIDQYDKFPEWIKYVHEAQNHIRWVHNICLLDTMDWSLVPVRVGFKA